MGYTHYWNQNGTIDPANWIEFAEGCNRLFDLVALSGVVLNDWSGEGEGSGKPHANGKEVSFNGTGAQSHESFCITRKPDKDAGGFCKTARKDYDTAVAAVLLYLDAIEPQSFEVSSDGHLWNYRDALDLARLAWPNKANMLDYPRALRDGARFARYLDSSHDFQVCEGHDGVLYIEEHATKALRCLPVNMQGDGFNAWIRTLDNTDLRKYGSFSGGESYRCDQRRLQSAWDMSESNPAAPVFYNSMIHGLLHPETTHA